MDNNHILLTKRITSIKNSNNSFCLLNFLSLEEQNIIKSMFSKNDLKQVYFYGGYENSFYKRAIISDSTVLECDFLITTLKISYNTKYANISHKDVMGSIISLGLKKEVFGDIIKIDDCFYLFVCSHIKDYIIDSLHMIKSTYVNISIHYDKINYTQEYIELNYICKSLRMDLVISHIINKSRNNVSEYINLKNIKVNHEIIDKGTKDIKVNDILSIRGYGRFLIKNIELKNNSKYLVCVYKYD